jgi:DNA-binding response OmpR family regulator
MPQTKHALIVENDQNMAGELTDLLKGIGFRVTILEDPSEAPGALESHEYEVALMNMQLPDQSWQNTLKMVREASRSTTIIMIARAPEENDVRTALNAGSYAVLERPLTKDQLTSLIAPKNSGMFVSLRE